MMVLMRENDQSDPPESSLVWLGLLGQNASGTCHFTRPALSPGYPPGFETRGISQNLALLSEMFSPYGPHASHGHALTCEP